MQLSLGLHLCINRMTLGDRWRADGFDDLRGYPLKLRAPVRTEEPVRPMLAGSEADRPAIVKVVVQNEQQLQRHQFYVLQSDLDDFGKTDHCEACVNMSLYGKGLVSHSQECRSRIQECLKETAKGRARLEK